VNQTALVDSAIQDTELKQFSLIRYQTTEKTYAHLRHPSAGVSEKFENHLTPLWTPTPHGPKATYLDSSWAPYLTKRNDIICVLKGCRLPLILRMVGKSGSKYRIIGACFLIDERLGKRPKFPNDKAFSEIMRGNIWDPQNYEDLQQPRYFDII